MDLTTSYMENLLENAIAFIPKMFLAVFLFFLGWYIARYVSRGLKRVLAMRRIDPEIAVLLTQLANWGIITFATIVALQQVGFDLSAFITGLGIVSFALSFAFQDIAKNFISGVLLLLQQPFDIGDAIEVSGFGGVVTNIEIRSTTIRTWDGKQVIIPNADVYTNPITNYSKSEKRRLELDVSVAYNTDLRQAEQLILAAVKGVAGVIEDDPVPTVIFQTFGDSGINIKIYYWFDPRHVDFFATQASVLDAVKRALENGGVEIPYPVVQIQDMR